MFTAEECRKLSRQYSDQASQPGVSPRMATVLKNMSKSFAALAHQFDLLLDIVEEERRHKRSMA